MALPSSSYLIQMKQTFGYFSSNILLQSIHQFWRKLRLVGPIQFTFRPPLLTAHKELNSIYKYLYQF